MELRLFGGHRQKLAADPADAVEERQVIGAVRHIADPGPVAVHGRDLEVRAGRDQVAWANLFIVFAVVADAEDAGVAGMGYGGPVRCPERPEPRGRMPRLYRWSAIACRLSASHPTIWGLGPSQPGVTVSW